MDTLKKKYRVIRAISGHKNKGSLLTVNNTGKLIAPSVSGMYVGSHSVANITGGVTTHISLFYK